MDNLDYRTESFRNRFKNAQSIIKAKSYRDLVSIKLREPCVNYHDYQEFIDCVQHDLFLRIEPLDNDLHEKTHIVIDSDNNKVILVVHETGLEILYIAGKICW